MGLSRFLRHSTWLPIPVALLGAWSAELTALQALAVTLLATLPMVLAGNAPWQGAALVLRPDGSAELERDAQALEAVTTGRAWLLGRVAVVELEAGPELLHLPVCAARNPATPWRRLRGWIRLGRLGARTEPGAGTG